MNHLIIVDILEGENIQSMTEVDVTALPSDIQCNIDDCQVRRATVSRADIRIKDGSYLVRRIEKSDAFWKWPERHDDLWYEKLDVFKELSPSNIIPATSRGVF